jgi:hypothetical protein
VGVGVAFGVDIAEKLGDSGAGDAPGGAVPPPVQAVIDSRQAITAAAAQARQRPEIEVRDVMAATPPIDIKTPESRQCLRVTDVTF